MIFHWNFVNISTNYLTEICWNFSKILPGFHRNFDYIFTRVLVLATTKGVWRLTHTPWSPNWRPTKISYFKPCDRMRTKLNQQQWRRVEVHRMRQYGWKSFYCIKKLFFNVVYSLCFSGALLLGMRTMVGTAVCRIISQSKHWIPYMETGFSF